MKKFIRILSSPALALVLLVLFAVAMAVATFIENDYGTDVAWRLVYRAWWFEMIMVGLGLSFLLNISRYGLMQRNKWPVLLFHLAFIVMLLGAAVTRYTSSTGVLRVREGESSNVLISDNRLLTVKSLDQSNRPIIEQELDLTANSDNFFELEGELEGSRLSVRYQNYLADAIQEVVPDSLGDAILELVVSDGTNGRTKIFLHRGEIKTFGKKGLSIGYDVDEDVLINFQESPEGMMIRSRQDLDAFVMATEVASTIQRDSLIPLTYRTLYRSRDISVVPLARYDKGEVKWMEDELGDPSNDELLSDVLLIDLTLGKHQKQVALMVLEGQPPITEKLEIGSVELELSYGSELIELPFAIYLNDFQLDRYPGSDSPAAYASEVEILENGQRQPFRIFMNNVLDHGGYRFYQASYDTDELGTVLAVNKDRPGTWITYLGYLLMGIGMCWTLFGRGTRFRQINKQLKRSRKAISILAILCMSGVSIAQQQTDPASYLNNQLEILRENRAADFGRLWVQDLDGRIKPVNTLASELIRKLTRKPYYQLGSIRLTTDQAFLSMSMDPDSWRFLPVIKVDLKKGGSLFEAMNPTPEGFVSLESMFSSRGDYLLGRAVEAANLKKPSERDEFDQEVLKVDERFNILYNMLSGQYLRIFPNKLDKNNTWFAPTHDFADFPMEDGQFARNILGVYYDQLRSGDRSGADESLGYVKTYQEVLGSDIIPSNTKMEAELIYNRLNLNFWLFQILFTIGAIMLLLAILRIFKSNTWLNRLYQLTVLLSFLAFLIFAGNIVLRWYIGGHAPWSNGYEMLVFVAWVLFLCGFLSYRQSDFTLPLSTLFSGALLFVSYLDWINPEITNLMPVLRSYWLKVHVATIVSSYAPLALSAVLGTMALILLLVRNQRNSARIDPKVKELTLINEISMTIGLFVLAIGTFLGGIWANESWGRYWAWDPKETWALISIIVYAIILHLRLVPGLAKPLILNAASMFGFWAIIMTSFGVNYYLSGLHSYASGDPLPIPDFVYILAVLQIAIWALAYYRDGRDRKDQPISNDARFSVHKTS